MVHVRFSILLKENRQETNGGPPFSWFGINVVHCEHQTEGCIMALLSDGVHCEHQTEGCIIALLLDGVHGEHQTVGCIISLY